MPPRAPNPREAALAAAEARLKNLQAPATDQPNVPAKEVWVQPSEQEDAQARRAFARLLDRGIVRDNNYQQSFIAVETILKIANNILSSDDPKFRTLKASNPTLKNKVLSAVGAHEYLIAMGFRTKTTDFILYYVLEPRMKRMHELKLGTEVLKEHMVQIEARSTSKEQSKLLAKDEEAQRKARALQEYEDDRAGVKARLEREKWVRENREKLKKEQEAAEKAKELQLEAQAAAFANMDRESEGDSDQEYQMDQMDPEENYHHDHDEDEEEEEEEEDWDWRGGNVLGSASDTATSSAVKLESSTGLRNRSGGMSTEVSNSAMAQNFNGNLDS